MSVNRQDRVRERRKSKEGGKTGEGPALRRSMYEAQLRRVKRAAETKRCLSEWIYQ